MEDNEFLLGDVIAKIEPPADPERDEDGRRARFQPVLGNGRWKANLPDREESEGFVEEKAEGARRYFVLGRTFGEPDTDETIELARKRDIQWSRWEARAFRDQVGDTIVLQTSGITESLDLMTQLGYTPIKGIERVLGANNPALKMLDDPWAMPA